MKSIANSFKISSLLQVAALVLVLVCALSRGEAYDYKTENVLRACAVLKQEHVHFDIYNINCEPACVYRVGQQYWFYDGEKGSNVLSFLPEQAITSEYTISNDACMPVNSCLIQALVSYKKHTGFKNNVIVFLQHHAINIYSNSNVEFLQKMQEYPVLAVYGASVSNERMSGLASSCIGLSL